jgi:hypothetical protein
VPKLSNLLAEKSKGDIQVGGSTIAFTFHTFWRERFSEEETAGFLELSTRDYLKAWLPRVLVTWDLSDDDGKPVPVTAEAIEQHALPDSLLLSFHAYVIASDLSGKVRTSNSSPGG